MSETMFPYPAVERDAMLESKDGAVSPMRVCREMAANAAAHEAPVLAELLNEVCDTFNRENHRANKFRGALKVLLFSLHARPLHGGPHLSLEDAIAEANALLDKDMEPKG